MAYQAALAAAGAATFSLGAASLRFLVVGLGGLLVGLAAGWLVAHLQRRLTDPPVEITVSLLTPFGAYLLAERLGVSGVLADGGCGPGRSAGGRRDLAPNASAEPGGLGDGGFLLNGLVFILIGLQLLRILAGAGQRARWGRWSASAR